MQPGHMCALAIVATYHFSGSRRTVSGSRGRQHVRHLQAQSTRKVTLMLARVLVPGPRPLPARPVNSHQVHGLVPRRGARLIAVQSLGTKPKSAVNIKNTPGLAAEHLWRGGFWHVYPKAKTLRSLFELPERQYPTYIRAQERSKVRNWRAMEIAAATRVFAEYFVMSAWSPL